MSAIVIIGNPVQGFNYHGPFDNVEEAADWGNDNSEGGDWWVTDLHAPVELPLHYPGAAVPIPPANESTWEPTHYSRKDGSGARLLSASARMGLFVNENGDEWPDPLDEWEPA
jgi:hypothetical protein